MDSDVSMDLDVWMSVSIGMYIYTNSLCLDAHVFEDFVHEFQTKQYTVSTLTASQRHKICNLKRPFGHSVELQLAE